MAPARSSLQPASTKGGPHRHLSNLSAPLAFTSLLLLPWVCPMAPALTLSPEPHLDLVRPSRWTWVPPVPPDTPPLHNHFIPFPRTSPAPCSAHSSRWMQVPPPAPPDPRTITLALFQGPFRAKVLQALSLPQVFPSLLPVAPVSPINTLLSHASSVL